MNNPLDYDRLADKATPFGKLVVAHMRQHQLDIKDVIHVLPLQERSPSARRNFFYKVVLGMNKNPPSKHPRGRPYNRKYLTLLYLVPLAFLLQVPTADLLDAYTKLLAKEDAERYVLQSCYFALDPMQQLALRSILTAFGWNEATQELLAFYSTLTGKQKATIDDTLQLWTNELLQTEEGRKRLVSLL